MIKLLLPIAISATLLSGCKTSQTAFDDRRAEISWTAFCAARGYDRDDNTYLTTNEYLDTWCGSAEEEEAFIKAGIKPY